MKVEKTSYVLKLDDEVGLIHHSVTFKLFLQRLVAALNSFHVLFYYFRLLDIYRPVYLSLPCLGISSTPSQIKHQVAWIGKKNDSTSLLTSGTV